MSTHEETSPERALPLQWKLWFVAGLLAALYVLCVVLSWTRQIGDIPAELSTMAIISVTVLFNAGGIDLILARKDALDAAAAERHELIAAKVDAVDEVVRQLTAAPTVNLHELRQMVRQQGAELQEQVMMGSVMVASRFTDVLKEGIQEVNLRVKDLEADLASFRLSQQATAKTNGSGKVGILRSLPSNPD